MKKVIALLAVAVISCALVVCAGCSKTPEITIGKTTVQLEEGFKADKLSQEDTDAGILYRYTKDDATYKVQVRTVDSSYGQSAEEFCKACGEALHGCVEYKTIPNSEAQAWLVSFAYAEGDYHSLVKSYCIEDGDKIMTLSYCYYTEKVDLGETGYYMWVPTCYEKPVAEHNDNLGAQVLKFSVAEKFGLADFVVVTSWDDHYSYAAAVKRCEVFGVTPACDEATFNALRDGDNWTMNSYFASLTAIFGDAETEHLSLTLDSGFQVAISCIEFVKDKVDYTCVTNGIKAPGKNSLTMVLASETEKWPGIGEAYTFLVGCDE